MVNNKKLLKKLENKTISFEGYKFVQTSQNKDLERKIENLAKESWPKYSLEASLGFERKTKKKWSSIYDLFPDFQFAVFDEEFETYIGSINSVPVFWKGNSKKLPNEGWEWALVNAISNYKLRIPNILIALGICVCKEHKGRKFGSLFLNFLKFYAKSNNFKTIFAPVRPTLKSLYPTFTLKQYIKLLNSEGQLFDPWLRTHISVGGRIIKICNKSMQFKSSISNWQNWTNLVFPASNKYYVPGMLDFLKIDLRKSEGLYEEPNVWIEHKI